MSFISNLQTCGGVAVEQEPFVLQEFIHRPRGVPNDGLWSSRLVQAHHDAEPPEEGDCLRFAGLHSMLHLLKVEIILLFACELSFYFSINSFHPFSYFFGAGFYFTTHTGYNSTSGVFASA